MENTNISGSYVKKELLSKYIIKDMNDWQNINADLIITDPPFGIQFTGKGRNYNRQFNNIVDGYVEWDVSEYNKKTRELLECISRNLKENGQALIFSGWSKSYIIHNKIAQFDDLKLRGKLYWIYNFAPYCKKRPAHNVYEIYWITKGDKWTYHNRCSTHHCQNGEPNLATIKSNRSIITNNKANAPVYPTRLYFEIIQILLEHFSNKSDLIFDPLAGSGMIGIVSHILGRNFLIGDINKNGKIVFEYLLEYYLSKKII